MNCMYVFFIMNAVELAGYVPAVSRIRIREYCEYAAKIEFTCPRFAYTRGEMHVVKPSQ